MTTYAFTLTLSEGQVQTLCTALSFFLEKCEAETKNEETVPYYAHIIDCKSILKKLYDNREQMSGVYFGNPDK